MNFATFARACALLCASAVAAPAFAAACVGFTDVDATSTFCPNVQWLKNRAVTLGCGDGTTYCPADPVNRIAMAAFMNRLGTALTPVDMAPSAGTSSLTLSATPVSCATTDFVVSGFPRRARIQAKADYYAPSATQTVLSEIVYSLNAGSTWTVIANSGARASYVAGATPPDEYTLTPFAAIDLDVGQSIRFGIRSSLAAGSGSISLDCVVRASVGNRNGTSAPL